MKNVRTAPSRDALTSAVYNSCRRILQDNQLNPVEALEVFKTMLVLHIADTCDAGREHVALDGITQHMHTQLTRMLINMPEMVRNNKAIRS